MHAASAPTRAATALPCRARASTIAMSLLGGVGNQHLAPLFGLSVQDPDKSLVTAVVAVAAARTAGVGALCSLPAVRLMTGVA